MAVKKTNPKKSAPAKASAKKKSEPATNAEPVVKKGGKVAKGLDEISRKDLLQIPFKFLEVEEGFNQRLNYGDIEELAEDIKNNGILTPLRVIPKPNVPNRFIVREGHRRFRALTLLAEQNVDVRKIPCQQTRETAEESYFKMASANNSLPFSMIEQGLVYKQLERFGYAAKDIQARFGIKNISRVYDALRLAESPKKLHAKLAEGVISQAVVLQVFRECKENWDDAVKRLDEAVVVATKDAESSGKEKAKVTAKHVKNLTTKTPVQKLQEAVEKANKKPDHYVKSKIDLASSLAEILHKKGTVEELLEVMEK